MTAPKTAPKGNTVANQATALDLSKLSFSELQKLSADAQALLSNKRSEEIKVLADAYAKKVTAAGFSIDEAIEALKPYKPAKKASAAKGVKLPAKYRGPNGEEWSGKGQDPKWLKAFIAAGKKKEDYLIK